MKDLDRARMLARQAGETARAILEPDQQARALADLARKAESDQARSLLARSLLARALVVGHWTTSIDVLLQISPAVIGIADEYLGASSSQ
jgi:hypothetical protein